MNHGPIEKAIMRPTLLIANGFKSKWTNNRGYHAMVIRWFLSFVLVTLCSLEFSASARHSAIQAGEHFDLPTGVRLETLTPDEITLRALPTNVTFGMGPCSEACELTIPLAQSVLQRYPTIQSVELWGWPIADSESRRFLEQLEKFPNVDEVSLVGLHVDAEVLSSITNSRVKKLSLLGDLKFSELQIQNGLGGVFAEFATSHKLQSLRIDRRTNIKLADIGLLAEAATLKHLSFDGRIDEASLKSIRTFRSLESLSLPKCSITDQAISHLSKLPKLQRLVCGGLHPNSPERLSGFRTLKSLTILSDPKSIDLAAISELPKLIELTVSKPRSPY